MVKRKYKVLVLGMSNNRAGVETFILNFVKHASPERFSFYIPEIGNGFVYEDELKKSGVTICECMPNDRRHYRIYRNACMNLFKKYNFDAIYYNTCDIVGITKLDFAKKAGVPVRIIHAHATGNDRKLSFRHRLMEKINKHRIKYVATHFYACSEEAGRWMFHNDNFLIMKNGIASSKFAFSNELRKKIREGLGLKEKFVIGHSGRFAEAKNHAFLIDVFKNVAERNPNAILMLVGKGKLEQSIRDRVAEYGLTDKVMFLGERNDVNELLQAMDVFVFPSVFEGFGIGLLEAQAAGLKCFASDAVPPSTNVTGKVEYLPLTDPKMWADAILKADYSVREDGSPSIRKAGYDVEDSAAFLEEKMLEALEEKLRCIKENSRG